MAKKREENKQISTLNGSRKYSDSEKGTKSERDMHGVVNLSAIVYLFSISVASMRHIMCGLNRSISGHLKEEEQS